MQTVPLKTEAKSQMPLMIGNCRSNFQSNWRNAADAVVTEIGLCAIACHCHLMLWSKGRPLVSLIRCWSCFSKKRNTRPSATRCTAHRILSHHGTASAPLAVAETNELNRSVGLGIKGMGGNTQGQLQTIWPSVSSWRTHKFGIACDV